MGMILAHIGRVLSGTLAALAVYAVARGLWLRGRGRPEWRRALLPWAFPRLRRWWKVLLIGGAAIAAVEVIQYVIGRTADIDDWLLNVAGIMAGYGLYVLFAGRKQECDA